MLVSDKCRVLAHDGPRFGAYLMVKGQDPVVFGAEHAFSAAENERFKKADGGMYKAGIYATWKERLNSVPEEIYFHPPHLTQIDGFMVNNTTTKLLYLAGVDVQVVHHHPGLFMKKLMDGL